MVAIIGGSGQIGKLLAAELASLGFRKVILIDRSPPTWNLFGFDFIKHDLKHENLINLEGIDVVFHLAGLKNPAHGGKDPEAVYKVNGFSMLPIMKSCHKYDVGTIIFASTTHVYGIKVENPVTEDSCVNPLSVYAGSKMIGEHLMTSYANQFKINGTIARISNVFGLSLDPQTIIGSALLQAYETGKIKINNANAIRDFIHVDDVVSGLISVASVQEKIKGPEIFNISSGVGTSTGSIVNMIADIYNKDHNKDIEKLEPRSNSPVTEAYYSIDKVKEIAGWSPDLSVLDGLRSIINLVNRT